MLNKANIPLLSVICLIALSMISCSRGPVAKKPTYIGKPGTQVPVVSEEYRISPGDQLEVKFFYTPELNEQQMVRPDGKISLQLIDEVLAAGRTPAELTSELKEKYSEELANPAVTVFVRTSSEMKIFLDGEIARPGVQPLVGPMSIMQAIASAGGLKETARRNEILIIRQKSDLSGPMVIPVDVNTIIDGTRMREDILLKPYDIVYVPRSPIGNLVNWIDLYLRRTLMVLPQEFLLYYNLTTR